MICSQELLIAQQAQPACGAQSPLEPSSTLSVPAGPSYWPGDLVQASSVCEALWGPLDAWPSLSQLSQRQTAPRDE